MRLVPGVMAWAGKVLTKAGTLLEQTAEGMKQLEITEIDDANSDASSTEKSASTDATPKSSFDGAKALQPDQQDDNEHDNKQLGIVAEDCEPTNVLASVKHRECEFSGVRFEYCNVGSVNFDKCDFENVIFRKCKFGGAEPTSWSNIILKNVTFDNCNLRDFFWKDDHREDVTVKGEVFEGKRWIEDEPLRMLSDAEANVKWVEADKRPMSEADAAAVAAARADQREPSFEASSSQSTESKNQEALKGWELSAKA